MADSAAPDVPRQLDLGDLAARAGASAGSVGVPAPAGGGGAGGYRFDPEQIDTLIAKWQALADELLVDGEIAVDLATIRGPGAEFASGMVAAASAAARGAWGPGAAGTRRTPNTNGPSTSSNRTPTTCSASPSRPPRR